MESATLLRSHFPMNIKRRWGNKYEVKTGHLLPPDLHFMPQWVFKFHRLNEFVYKLTITFKNFSFNFWNDVTATKMATSTQQLVYLFICVLLPWFRCCHVSKMVALLRCVFFRVCVRKSPYVWQRSWRRFCLSGILGRCSTVETVSGCGGRFGC